MSADNITVSGRNMELGEALPIHVTTHMNALSEKYFGKMVTCRVVFSKMPKHHINCRIQVIVGQDMFYVSEGESDDVHLCFRQALEKLAKQLRRHKRELHEDKPTTGKADLLDEMLRPDPEV